LGVIMLAGAPSLAQAATSNGPYYAEPAWDQKLAPATRFIVLTDWNSEAVLDRETGLVWEQAPETAPAVWSFARVVCSRKTVGGRFGWRLPSVYELASLMDPTQSNPALPLGHPFTNVQSEYWSATTSAVDPTRAWHVSLFLGNVGSLGFKVNEGQVWCVRGGMNAEAY
jgi:hypothetical protein